MFKSLWVYEKNSMFWFKSADDKCGLSGLICEINEVCTEDEFGEYSCSCKNGFSKTNGTCTGKFSNYV